MFLCPSGHGRRPRRTPPDTGRKSPETAMLNVSPDPAPSLQSPNPAHRHTAAVRPPRGCAVGAARLRAGTAARLRVAAPYCELAAAARPVTGDTTPYDKRPAELHNPRITQATYMSIWESAHLAGRRCRVGIGPPCRAPLPCGNRPTLPGAAAVWKSAHLAGRCCRVGIGPPCRVRNCIGLDYPFAFYLVTVCRLLDHHQLNLSH